MESVLEFLRNTWQIALEASPWLLVGLLAAGLIYGFVPTERLTRWLGGRGMGAIVRAAIIGAPLPLCSCGVIPAAVSLRRRGASPGATSSFLVATPETGVDSIAISYALLGPFLTIVRPIAAILSAIVTGLTIQFLPQRAEKQRADTPLPIGPGAQNADEGCCEEKSTGSPCCSDGGDESSSCCDSEIESEPPRTVRGKFALGMRYAATNLVDDLGVWIVVGIVLAGAAATFMSVETLGDWSSGILTMLVMALIGVPMYICATASTPLAAGLLIAGLSPGTVLVFLLAGPATNLATLGIVRRELGTAQMIAYVVAIAVSAIGLGLLTDVIANAAGWQDQAREGMAHLMHPAIGITALVILVLLAIRPLRRRVIGA